MTPWKPAGAREEIFCGGVFPPEQWSDHHTLL
jgi:hypothetical protein